MNESIGTPNHDPYAAPRAAIVGNAVRARDHAVTLANRWVRLGARLIDNVFLCLTLIPYYATVVVKLIELGSQGSRAEHQPSLRELFRGTVAIGFGITCLLILAMLVLQLVLLARNGQTLGKKLVKIKIARPDGSPASFGRIFGLRILLCTVLDCIPLFALIDVLFIFGEQRRCLHDRIAETIVIDV